MPTALIHFHRLIQDSQDYGSDDEHMVSRVFFTLELEDGQRYSELSADIKQTVGTDFHSAELEVSRPHGYKGMWNHASFSEQAQLYYRRLVGERGFVINFGPGAGNIRMSHNIMEVPVTVEIDLSGSTGTW